LRVQGSSVTQKQKQNQDTRPGKMERDFHVI